MRGPDVQDFLKVFEQLRDEIVNDDLLDGQPESSKQWVKEVRMMYQFSGCDAPYPVPAASF